ncbi:hypothetical protein OIV83_005520 [Microbotryomycetes sp. JL201]|nr:hypothetical protein OIV83_005520 [Microbotryomycetes sp. JL201]
MDLPDPSHACARLLPTLLSPEPCSISVQQLAQPTAQAHHFLNTRPTQHEYLQPVAVKQKVIELHNRLVEAGHLGEVRLGQPLYAVDDTSIRALVPVGGEGLACVVMWEEQSLPNSAFGHGDSSDDEERPAWAFQTLDVVPSDRDRGQLWHSTLDSALEHVADLLKTRPVNIAQHGKRIKTKEEMAEGEGTTPGAYGAPEDFWAGWNDDDDGNDGGSATGMFDTANRDTRVDIEDGYWARYAESGSQVGDESRSLGNRSFDSLDMDDGDDDAPMPHERVHMQASRPLATAPGTPDRQPVQTRSRRSSTIKPPPTPPVQKPTEAPAAAATSSDTSARSKFYLADSSASSSAELNSSKVHSNPLSAAGSAVALAAQTAAAIASSSSNQSTSLSAVPSFLSMDSRGSKGSFAMGAAPLDNAGLSGNSLDREKLDTVSKQLEQLQAASSNAEEEGLRFALAGVWQLFARSRAGTREQRDMFLRVASQVTQP